jgi:hypothetical protein
MSTCNRLDLQTLGSPPILPKNLADHGVGATLWSNTLKLCALRVWPPEQATAPHLIHMIVSLS